VGERVCADGDEDGSIRELDDDDGLVDEVDAAVVPVPDPTPAKGCGGGSADVGANKAGKLELRRGDLERDGERMRSVPPPTGPTNASTSSTVIPEPDLSPF